MKKMGMSQVGKIVTMIGSVLMIIFVILKWIKVSAMGYSQGISIFDITNMAGQLGAYSDEPGGFVVFVLAAGAVITIILGIANVTLAFLDMPPIKITSVIGVVIAVIMLIVTFVILGALNKELSGMSFGIGKISISFAPIGLLLASIAACVGPRLKGAPGAASFGGFAGQSRPAAYNCPNCGAAVDANSGFCVQCGQKIEIRPGGTQVSGDRFCTECGSKIQPGNAFCTVCGTRAE